MSKEEIKELSNKELEQINGGGYGDSAPCSDYCYTESVEPEPGNPPYEWCYTCVHICNKHCLRGRW